LAITGNVKTERNKIMIDKILSELKAVIDHTTNKDHAHRLFKCYEQLEKYKDESLPVDCIVKPANGGEEHILVKEIISALTTDGAHHKQWYLERIFRIICTDEYVNEAKEHFEWEDGIAP